MLSATSHIGLEFLTKFLNMSKLQNRLILLYQSLPLHSDEGLAQGPTIVSWERFEPDTTQYSPNALTRLHHAQRTVRFEGLNH